MKVIKVPSNESDPDMILQAEPSEYLPDKIVYRHNEKHIYVRQRDKNGR